MERNNRALDVVHAYHDAWTSGDYDAAGTYLAEDLKTEVPINHYDSKASFLAAVRGFGQAVTDIDLLASLGGPDEAMLLYDLDVKAIGKLRVAEHFTVRDGAITRIRHVHDTAALIAAGL